MKAVTLDKSKLLGFRIAQGDDGKMGLKLGIEKVGYSKPAS